MGEVPHGYSYNLHKEAAKGVGIPSPLLWALPLLQLRSSPFLCVNSPLSSFKLCQPTRWIFAVSFALSSCPFFLARYSGSAHETEKIAR